MAQIYRTDDHDTVLRKFAELIEKNNPGKFQISTALDEGGDRGDRGSVEIGGVKPDIVLKSSDGDQILLVIEVETSSTISLVQASQRWKPISAAAPAFQVVVPKGSLNSVRRLCRRLEIKARFQEY